MIQILFNIIQYNSTIIEKIKNNRIEKKNKNLLEINYNYIKY